MAEEVRGAAEGEPSEASKPVRGAAEGEPSEASKPSYDKLIFELSSPGRHAFSLPEPDVPKSDVHALLPERHLRRQGAELPEVSEVDVIRHYSRLSRLNYGVDTHFYPLGSCTMKYNPRINEDMARLPGFGALHPLAPEEASQGALQLMHELAADLAEIAGMDAVSLQPAAGAQGELAGVLMIRAYHLANGERRTKVLIPDSAHGTNPASTAIAGYRVVQLKSEANGEVDVLDLERNLDNETAAFMLTLPNTLGMFEPRIIEIIERCHAKGVQVYMDGANLNAILGIVRPGDLGFDVCHFNLHKTFTTPHGGGGPGAGPVGVKSHLMPFLPTPVVTRREGRARRSRRGAERSADAKAGGAPTYALDWNRPKSIGKLQTFWGNFGMLVRAYTYIRTMGPAGLRSVSDNAVLNANYVMKRLEPYYDAGAPGPCMHECVMSARRQKKLGVTALDIAKRLLDLGFYAPSIYFPLIVEEALMIEPTETESKETLDEFCDAMIRIAKEAEEHPAVIHDAPLTTPVRRLDQTRAARYPDLRWRPPAESSRV
ncbi:MAG TPA: aminomethyl-transferring glycine dehydrogenase subunit GcvPB [Methylomirabilota bacterium]|nr:aminomethyl-transferring glycine dehydrogenase subunit GcvPB [Methylomirabilota bacterium]